MQPESYEHLALRLAQTEERLRHAQKDLQISKQETKEAQEMLKSIVRAIKFTELLLEREQQEN